MVNFAGIQRKTEIKMKAIGLVKYPLPTVILKLPKMHGGS